MDVEEVVYEGSEDDKHQQKQYPHGIPDVFFGFLKIFIKDNNYIRRLDISYTLF